MDKRHAETLLQTMVGSAEAHFRPGQWQAVDALVNQQQRLMVVQRTGWGKSAVYFVSTAILRQRGAGPTLIVSPLLALMRNQVQAAERLGIRAISINSANTEAWDGLLDDLHGDRVDALLISPERFSNPQFADTVLPHMLDRIGLFVVDEAHCISDWGHDFRPDYRMLVHIIQQLPPTTPVLGTTATANDRVLADIQAQLGNVQILRGPLMRESLLLQNLHLPDQISRLAWLAEHIPHLPHSGIVYVLTKRDAEQVSQWLNRNHIAALPYYSGVQGHGFTESNSYRLYLEDQLIHNKIKVLVATSALGMGYDKPDLGFVIHYQAPGSVISYYQQVGRAGRALEQAYGILFHGAEDEAIHHYFRQQAFPSPQEVETILEMLHQHGATTTRGLMRHGNLGWGAVEKALKYLSVQKPAPVTREGSQWQLSGHPFNMDHAHIDYLTSQRELEWQEMQRYVQSPTCLMRFLRNALDDPDASNCGRCAVCRGQAIVPTRWSAAQAAAARTVMQSDPITWEPRKQTEKGAFVLTKLATHLPKAQQAQVGRALCRWQQAEWGQLAAQGYKKGHFAEALVQAMAHMIQQWNPQPAPTWVTCVPSSRMPTRVPDLALRLAQQLKLPFATCVSQSRPNARQKTMRNSFYQCRNLDGVFALGSIPHNGPVLLVDDFVDSRWTFTVVAALLAQGGVPLIYPTAMISLEQTL
ncbi:ATP-dependent DNA helicase, RecQ-like protein [Magnetococcus marinus MC-1]|uniref:DNA 3'-5' helicase n=1 Tax=Magnetococcus marinus (strain ATCC BAA-1437 / JCM 17883 / MC-1) TaxID=156889 RepID=A0L4W7_MAGMM|nr:RecQ family ATP-dependent DNA helicase [Magnetococcus marinus]ABK43010.1 ATP-dependent DNA helicase, RecQ-like protein [Magnetococcus marinus MC-1]